MVNATYELVGGLDIVNSGQIIVQNAYFPELYLLLLVISITCIYITSFTKGNIQEWIFGIMGIIVNILMIIGVTSLVPVDISTYMVYFNYMLILFHCVLLALSVFFYVKTYHKDLIE